MRPGRVQDPYAGGEIDSYNVSGLTGGVYDALDLKGHFEWKRTSRADRTCAYIATLSTVSAFR